MVAAVKALACQLPGELGLPLSRLSISEIHREVLERGLDPRAVRRAVRYGRAEELSRPH